MNTRLISTALFSGMMLILLAISTSCEIDFARHEDRDDWDHHSDREVHREADHHDERHVDEHHDDDRGGR